MMINDKISGRRPLLPIGLALIVAAALILISMTENVKSFFSTNTSELLIISAILVTAVLPTLLALAGRQLDPFEPSHVVNLLTLFYFSLVPLVAVKLGNTIETRSGIDYRSMLSWTLFAAWLAQLGFLVGYYQARHRRWMLLPWLNTVDHQRAHRLSLWGLVLTIGLVGLWVLLTGLSFRHFNVFASNSSYGILQKAQTFHLGYLYSSRLMLTPMLVLSLAYLKRRQSLWWWLPLWVFTFLFYFGSGTRWLPIALALATVSYLAMRRGSQRLTMRKTLLLVLTSLFLFFGVFILVGMNRRNLPAGELQTKITGEVVWTHTEAGASLWFGMASLLQNIPRNANFRYGWGYLALLTAPIPRMLWPAKPRLLEGIPLTYAPPVFGDFYVEFGFPGIFVGMAILGMLTAGVYETLRQQPSQPLAQVLLALTLGDFVQFYSRGGYLVSLNSLLFTVFPVVVIAYMARRRTTHNKYLVPMSARTN